MPIPPELADVLVSTPDTLSGAIRFRDSRVPVQALLDTLHGGLPVSDFHEGFQGIPSEHTDAVVRWMSDLARRELGVGGG